MPTLDAAFDEASGSSSRTPSPVGLEAGAGRRSVSMAADEDEKVRRLSVWEDQLHAYQHELADEGWKSWKRGAVNSLMNELQRKVVPEVWREEVAQSSRKEAELNNALRRAGEKERALLARIDALENGPGCARELQAQLESMELKMSQGEQRQKQRRVMHELLAKESPLDTLRSEGGGRRRAVSMAVTAFDAGTTPRDARAAAAADGASAEVHAEMLARVSVAQRQAKEAAAELATTKAESEKQITKLEKALEAEKELHRRAKVAFESQITASGVHEAQEMVQLKMEVRNSAAQFCRAILPRTSAAQLWRDFAQFSDGLLATRLRCRRSPRRSSSCGSARPTSRSARTTCR